MTNKHVVPVVPQELAEIANDPVALWANKSAIVWLRNQKFSGLNDSEIGQVFALAAAHKLNPFKHEFYAYVVYGKNQQRKLITIISYFWFLKKIMSHSGYQGHKFDVVLEGDTFKVVNGVVQHERTGCRNKNQRILCAWAYVRLNDIEYYHTLDASDYWPSGGPNNSSQAVKDLVPAHMIKKAALSQLIRQLLPEDTAGLLSDAEKETVDAGQKAIMSEPENNIIDVEPEDETEDLTPLVNEIAAIIKVQFKDNLPQAKTYLSLIVGGTKYRKLKECTREELEKIKTALLDRQAKNDREEITSDPAHERKVKIIKLNEFFNGHFGDIAALLDFYDKQGIKDPDNLTDGDIELLEAAKAQIEDYKKEKEENENPKG